MVLEGLSPWPVVKSSNLLVCHYPRSFVLSPLVCLSVFVYICVRVHVHACVMCLYDCEVWIVNGHMHHYMYLVRGHLYGANFRLLALCGI